MTRGLTLPQQQKSLLPQQKIVHKAEELPLQKLNKHQLQQLLVQQNRIVIKQAVCIHIFLFDYSGVLSYTRFIRHQYSS